MTAPDVTLVRYAAAPALDALAGTLGTVTVQIDRLQIGGIRVRRVPDGRLLLVYPPRVQPVDSVARAAIQAQVLAALEARR